MSKKTKIIILVLMMIVPTVSLVLFTASTIRKEYYYQKAIDSVKAGKYEEARDEIIEIYRYDRTHDTDCFFSDDSKLQWEYNDDDFDKYDLFDSWIIQPYLSLGYNSEFHPYRNSFEVFAYADDMIDYIKEFPSDPNPKAYGLAQNLRISYNGPFAEEINAIKEKERYFQNHIPEDGMNIYYLQDTMLGKANCSDVTDNKGWYAWFAHNDFDCIVFAEVSDGYVTKVSTYGHDIYWNADGTPNLTVNRDESLPYYPTKYDLTGYPVINPNSVKPSDSTSPHRSYGYSYGYSSGSSSSKSSSKKSHRDSYSDGYEDVYDNYEPNWSRYDSDEDYALGADDAMDELGDW